jgi:hypothetical protein
MSNLARTLLHGSRKTNGIYEYGERILREIAARILAGTYDGRESEAPAPSGF